jgi:hypothetical protein
MTYYQAAMAVLGSSKKPLSTRELLDRVIELGLVESTGQTPEATLSAALYRHAMKDPVLRRVFVPGSMRAKRGSVRWTLDSSNSSLARPKATVTASKTRRSSSGQR